MSVDECNAGSVDSSPYRAVAEGSPDLHTLCDLDGVYRYVSPMSGPLFGWRPDELVGQAQTTLVHADDRSLVDKARTSAIDDPSRIVTTVCRFRSANGTYRWTESVSTLVSSGDERLLVSSVRDIADRKQAEVELQRMASTDPLTGVANRTVFMDRLQQALRRLDRRDGLVAVLFLDLDHFKTINDSVGHGVGDAVLLQMAERLRGCLRPQDTLARLGGDEFAVVVEDMRWAEQAEALAARIVEAGRVRFRVSDDHFTCTTSVGIAVTADSQRSADGVLQEADLALYRAKDRGRDRAEVFDENLRTRAVGRLAVERMLRRAIEEERLHVEFQPIVELSTGRTVAAEALVRIWDSDQEDLVAAASFIEIAEQTGLLGAIDQMVLEEAVTHAARWRQLLGPEGFEDIAVNVTARHLADPDFAPTVIAFLAAEGLPPAALQVEVTERVLMEASNSAMTALTHLRAAGVKVGLDDFGTGYSSLSYLRMFPLDFVKIDQSFVAELGQTPTNRAIVGSIIDLSHALGMAVVAEGVETEIQRDELTSLGCDRAQGFLFAAAGAPEIIGTRVLAQESA